MNKVATSKKVQWTRAAFLFILGHGLCRGGGKGWILTRGPGASLRKVAIHSQRQFTCKRSPPTMQSLVQFRNTNKKYKYYETAETDHPSCSFDSDGHIDKCINKKKGLAPAVIRKSLQLSELRLGCHSCLRWFSFMLIVMIMITSCRSQLTSSSGRTRASTTLRTLTPTCWTPSTGKR